ncbi:hypothetical protein CXG81DRAFT_21431 [Caulochytrium protostelioides]|uniref:Smr domain-containing protein n=1 Tax=Caulochytrium protostelioides TaxID=1555241 RepID=A0A4P9X0U5_9FUNG|nr:hypothetical protein CXG81DRAFT_21431 [Caulochytrium protostelioides]|eukprot:RKO98318.1 hypothetical protein CXG81DRAFT_21431 [Caulochytrium protostelioides]
MAMAIATCVAAIAAVGRPPAGAPRAGLESHPSYKTTEKPGTAVSASARRDGADVGRGRRRIHWKDARWHGKHLATRRLGPQRVGVSPDRADAATLRECLRRAAPRPRPPPAHVGPRVGSRTVRQIGRSLTPVIGAAVATVSPSRAVASPRLSRLTLKPYTPLGSRGPPSPGHGRFSPPAMADAAMPFDLAAYLAQAAAAEQAQIDADARLAAALAAEDSGADGGPALADKAAAEALQRQLDREARQHQEAQCAADAQLAARLAASIASSSTPPPPPDAGSPGRSPRRREPMVGPHGAPPDGAPPLDMAAVLAEEVQQRAQAEAEDAAIARALAAQWSAASATSAEGGGDGRGATPTIPPAAAQPFLTAAHAARMRRHGVTTAQLLRDVGFLMALTAPDSARAPEPPPVAAAGSPRRPKTARGTPPPPPPADARLGHCVALLHMHHYDVHRAALDAIDDADAAAEAGTPLSAGSGARAHARRRTQSAQASYAQVVGQARRDCAVDRSFPLPDGVGVDGVSDGDAPWQPVTRSRRASGTPTAPLCGRSASGDRIVAMGANRNDIAGDGAAAADDDDNDDGDALNDEDDDPDQLHEQANRLLARRIALLDRIKQAPKSRVPGQYSVHLVRGVYAEEARRLYREAMQLRERAATCQARQHWLELEAGGRARSPRSRLPSGTAAPTTAAATSPSHRLPGAITRTPAPRSRARADGYTTCDLHYLTRDDAVVYLDAYVAEALARAPPPPSAGPRAARVVRLYVITGRGRHSVGGVSNAVLYRHVTAWCARFARGEVDPEFASTAGWPYRVVFTVTPDPASQKGAFFLQVLATPAASPPTTQASSLPLA